MVTARSIAVLLSAAAIGPGAFQGDTTPSGLTQIKHAPIQVRRNDDGSLARGRNQEVETSNWSGYAVANFETGQTYTAAQASWVVPAVTFDAGAKSENAPQYSSTWVGIGGFCENARCNKVDHTLIQLGTEQDVTVDGTTNYYSWYEMLPQFPLTPIGTYPVKPKDNITASLQCIASCSGKKQIWTLSMMNTTQGWHWSVTVPYSSSKLSAVWIEEAPSSGGILPLADFGTVAITDLTGNDSNPDLRLGNNGIVMADPWGQFASPSDADGAPDFNVCWGASPGPPGC